MINVGIIGCGSIARKRHAVEYQNNENVKIAGFCDFNRERAVEMVDIYDGKVYDSVDKMLEDEQIDAVSVCVANTFHAEITIKALNQGKHVLCEKPMAITLDDCLKMIEASREADKRLMIGHNQRLAPAHVKAREIILSGHLGKVLSFASTFGHKGPETWSIDKGSNTWFFKKQASAFGSMADLGIHKIDLMHFLLGDQVEHVYASLTTLDKRFSDGSLIEVDDNSTEVIQFKAGALGTVTTSWTYYGAECNKTIIYCQKGILRLYDDPEYSLMIEHIDGTIEKHALDKIQTNDDQIQVNSGVIDTFIEGIRTGNKTVIDGDVALESMKVVFASIESAEQGCKVYIS